MLWFIIFGIHIDSISYENIKINSLYLKLDKKLIIKAKKIDIAYKITENNDTKSVDKYIQDVRKYVVEYSELFEYIQSIDIENIQLNEDNFTIYTDGENCKISSKQFEIDTDIYIKDDKITIDTKSLSIDKYDINIQAITNISRLDDKVDTNITAILQSDYKFYLYATYQDKYISADASSEYIEDLEFIRKFTDLDEDIAVWLYDNIAGSFKLDNATARYHTASQTLIAKSIKAKATVQDAKVKFHKELESVHTTQAKLTYDDKRLHIALGNSTYMGGDISGSKVALENLTNDDDILLKLDITAKAIFDKNIKNILSVYGIKVPIIQKSGSLDSKIKLNINLSNFDIDTKVQATTLESTFELFGVDMSVKSGQISIQNNIIKIDSNDTTLLDSMVSFDTHGMVLDTNSSQIRSDIYLKNFAIKSEGQNILGIKKKHTSLEIDYEYDLSISLPELSIYALVKNDIAYITIDELSQFYDYSPLLQDIQIQEGSVFVRYTDPKDMSFFFNIDRHNSPLMVDTIQLNGDLKGDNIDIASTDGNIKIAIDDKETKVHIKNIDIDKQKLIQSKEENSVKKTTISATYSNIKFGDKKALLATDFDLIMEGKSLYFLSKFLDTHVYFAKDELGNILYKIENTEDIFVNSLIGIGYFTTGGRVDVIGSNKDQNPDVLSGKVYIKQVVFQDFATLSSMLTLINSTIYAVNPILIFPTIYRVVRGDVVFNGYKAIKGKISYSYNLKTLQLNLPHINIKGGELDLKGNAKFDFQGRKIEANIRAVILKDVSRLILNIPLLKNILLGDTEDIYIRTYIKGDIDDPKIGFVK